MNKGKGTTETGERLDTKMKKIELVVSCYSVDRPWYAALFCCQLSSLAIYRPKKCKVKVSLCCSPKDDNLKKLLEYFHSLGSFDLSITFAEPEVIAKRAIHRNKVSLGTDADIVWYTDPDFCFGPDCLDSLAEIEFPEDKILFFPEEILEQYKHAANFEYLKEVLERGRLTDPLTVHRTLNNFWLHKFHRAMGSLQIVEGKTARRLGYCPNYKNHQTPTDKPFVNYSSVSDRNFRRECRSVTKSHDFQQAIWLPHIYRLSHPSRKLSPEEAKEKYGW